MSLRNAITTIALAAAASAACATSGGPAAVHCGDTFTVFEAGYVDCAGPAAGGFASSVSFAGHGSYTLVGITGDASGAFSADPGAVSYGALALGAAQGGGFVIGLRGAATHSLYLFDGSGGAISGLSFDTYGVADALGYAGPDLVSAALYVNAVPEPASVALMLAGLGAVGVGVRRRRIGG